jgi:hypothetical protein
MKPSRTSVSKDDRDALPDYLRALPPIGNQISN